MKRVERPLIAPVVHGGWWITVGFGFEQRKQWLWGMSSNSSFGKWNCGACGGFHRPSEHLACRSLCLGKPKLHVELEEGEPAFVVARPGDIDLDESDQEGN